MSGYGQQQPNRQVAPPTYPGQGQYYPPGVSVPGAPRPSQPQYPQAQGVRQPSPIPQNAAQPQQSQGVPRPGLPTGFVGYPMGSQALNNLAPRPRSALPDSHLSDLLARTDQGRAVSAAIYGAAAAGQPQQQPGAPGAAPQGQRPGVPNPFAPPIQIVPSASGAMAQAPRRDPFAPPIQQRGPTPPPQARGPSPQPYTAYRPQGQPQQQMQYPGQLAMQPGQPVRLPALGAVRQAVPQTVKHGGPGLGSWQAYQQPPRPQGASPSPYMNSAYSGQQRQMYTGILQHQPVPSAPVLTEDDRRVLPHKSLKRKATSIAGADAQLDPSLVAALTQVCDDFISGAVAFASGLARRRKSDTLAAADVAVYLDRTWQIHVPGFSGPEVKPYRRPSLPEVHQERAALVRKATAAASEAAAEAAKEAAAAKLEKEKQAKQAAAALLPDQQKAPPPAS